MLRTSLEGEKITAPDTVIHHEDMVIHPPIFEDLQNELEEFDKLFDVPKKDEAPKEEPVTEIKEEIELPERPKGILNIPPPPKKDSA